MPKYDFRCRGCGNVFEDSKRMTDPNPACAKCGEQTDVAFLAPPKAHFQGGGWAADNYSSSKKSMTVNQMIDRGSGS
jgi:putative FmdB family regulatory protein